MSRMATADSDIASLETMYWNSLATGFWPSIGYEHISDSKALWVTGEIEFNHTDNPTTLLTSSSITNLIPSHNQIQTVALQRQLSRLGTPEEQRMSIPDRAGPTQELLHFQKKIVPFPKAGTTQEKAVKAHDVMMRDAGSSLRIDSDILPLGKTAPISPGEPNF